VGIYFITQNPIDIPDSILGQLGNRIQHALRAFTPNDQKAVKAAARTFRPNPAFETEDAIMQLGTGEALVSFLEENGAPAMVEKAKILFPLSSIGAITDAQRSDIIHKSRLFGIYERSIDRQSAYEVLSAQNQVEAQRQKQEEDQKAYEKEQAQRAKEEAQRQKEAAQQQKEMERQYRTSAPSRTSSRTSPLEKAIGSAASSIGRNLGNQIIRSILGSIFKR
jgi:DNA helicase HerA-like ATPase